MATFLFILQLLVVLSMIFVGARVGGIGLGIYGMVGMFVLTFVFRLEPGAIPIDVMLIIVSVITASAALQAAGGLDYMVNVAARFLRRHPSHITYLAPLTTWLFCVLLCAVAHHLRDSPKEQSASGASVECSHRLRVIRHHGFTRVGSYGSHSLAVDTGRAWHWHR